MGRPIKSKYFGNRNYPYDNSQSGGNTGVGGEGVATIAINNSGTYYASSSTLTLTFSAPQIAGGVAATGRVTTNGSRNIATVTLLTAGTGYTSAPTATVNGGTTGTTATFTISLTSTVANDLAVTAYLTTGSSAINGGDIMKQEASRRYLVNNAQGKGQVKLVTTDTLTPGTMKLIATDFSGATYFVKKLTARKAVLVSRTNTGTALVASGRATGWTLGAATGTIVTLSNN